MLYKANESGGFKRKEVPKLEQGQRKDKKVFDILKHEIKISDILEKQKNNDEISIEEQSRVFIALYDQIYQSKIDKLEKKEYDEKGQIEKLSKMKDALTRREDEFRYQLLSLGSQSRIEKYEHKATTLKIEYIYAKEYPVYQCARKHNFSNQNDYQAYLDRYSGNFNKLSSELYDEDMIIYHNNIRLCNQKVDILEKMIKSSHFSDFEKQRFTTLQKEAQEQIISYTIALQELANEKRLDHKHKNLKSVRDQLDLDKSWNDLGKMLSNPQERVDLQKLSSEQREAMLKEYRKNILKYHQPDLIKRYAAIIEEQKEFSKNIGEKARDRNTTLNYHARYDTSVSFTHGRVGQKITYRSRVKGQLIDQDLYETNVYPEAGLFVVEHAWRKLDLDTSGPEGTQALHASDMAWEHYAAGRSEARAQNIKTSDDPLTGVGFSMVLNKSIVKALKKYIPAEGNATLSLNSLIESERYGFREALLSSVGKGLSVMLKKHQSELGNKEIEIVTLSQLGEYKLARSNHDFNVLNSKFDITRIDNQFIYYVYIPYIGFLLRTLES